MKTRDLVLTFCTSTPRFPAQLAAKCDKKAAAVSRCLDSLERDKLVAGVLMLHTVNHATGSARYSRAYTITPAGIAVVDKLDKAVG
jgi:hypothetical protein